MTESLPMRGLSQRAAAFVRAHGNRIPADMFRRTPADSAWQGVERDIVERAAAYERDWGNLYLPPSIAYNGGPKYLGPEIFLGDLTDAGYIGAGPARFSVSYDFLLDRDGTFGIGEIDFVPLYRSVAGWIESLALEYELRRIASKIERIFGSEVAALDLSVMRQFPSVSGIADSWFIDDEAVLFLCRGRALMSKYPDDEFAISFSGIAERDIQLGLE